MTKATDRIARLAQAERRATPGEVRMVQRVSRKRIERDRTLSRRLARQTKNFVVGRA